MSARSSPRRTWRIFSASSRTESEISLAAPEDAERLLEPALRTASRVPTLKRMHASQAARLYRWKGGRGQPALSVVVP